MKKKTDKVTRRLYSLYPDHIRKLGELAKQSRMPASEYLRELIDVAYATKLNEEREGKVIYGVED